MGKLSARKIAMLIPYTENEDEIIDCFEYGADIAVIVHRKNDKAAAKEFKERIQKEFRMKAVAKAVDEGDLLSDARKVFKAVEKKATNKKNLAISNTFHHAGMPCWCTTTTAMLLPRGFGAVGGEGVMPSLFPCFSIRNLAVLHCYHHIKWRLTEVLADGFTIFGYNGNFHCLALPILVFKPAVFEMLPQNCRPQSLAPCP